MNILAVYLMVSCVALAAPSAEAPESAWQTLTIDRVGWVGLKDDVQQLRREAPDVFYDYLVENSRVWIAAVQEEAAVFLAYYPSPSGLATPEAMGLRLAEVSLSPRPEVRTRVTLEDGLTSDAAPLLVPWQGASFGVSDGRYVLWYYDPTQGALVEHGVRDGSRDLHDAPVELRHLAFLDMAAEPGVRRVHFAARVHTFEVNRWIYGVFDGELGKWRIANFPWSWPLLVKAERGKVYLLQVGKRATKLLSRSTIAGRGLVTADSQQLDPGAWQQEVIGPSGYADPHYLLIPGQGEAPQVLCAYFITFDLFELSLFHKQHGVWTKEVVKTARLPDPEPGRLPAFLAPSAAIDAAGQLHIAYYDPEAAEIRHLWRGEKLWRSETVVPLDLAGSTAIAAVGDKLVIAYFVPNALEIRLAWRNLPPEQIDEGAAGGRNSGSPSRKGTLP